MRFSQGIHPSTCQVNWPVLICLLGSFRLLKAGQLIPMRIAGKTQALLVNLALRPNYSVSRETILQALWPEAELPLASQSLNTLVHALHKQLGDQIDGAPPVVQSDGYCRLNVEAGVGLDVGWFDALAHAGLRQERAGDQAEAIALYSCAIDLYRGDLCNSPEIPALVEREYLRGLYLTLLARLADHAFSSGDKSAALDLAMRLLSVDPCREDAHRMVMRCYLQQGQRAQALRQYQLCETILHTQFDARPEPATSALYDQIRLDPASALTLFSSAGI